MRYLVPPAAAVVAALAAAPFAGTRLAAQGPPPGTYQCYDSYTEVGAPTKITYKEQLVVVDRSTYRFRANGPVGKYEAGAKGAIRFLSGPYAGGNPAARYERKWGGKDVITLTYTFPKLGSDDDYCVRR